MLVMKYFAIVFTFWFGMCLEAEAQRTNAPIQKITNCQEVPADVKVQLPKGAVTKFFGTFKLPLDARTFLLHLYAEPLSKQEFAQADFYQRRLGKNYFLDVFVRDEIGQKQKLKRLSSTFISYKTLGLGDFGIAVEAAWLDAKTRRVPLIVIETDSVGFHGKLGQNLFLVFAQGWKSKAVSQSFQVGNWGLEEVYAPPAFGDPDGQGLLTLHLYDETLHWNGRRFVTESGKYVGG